MGASLAFSGRILARHCFQFGWVSSRPLHFFKKSCSCDFSQGIETVRIWLICFAAPEYSFLSGRFRWVLLCFGASKHVSISLWLGLGRFCHGNIWKCHQMAEEDLLGRARSEWVSPVKAEDVRWHGFGVKLSNQHDCHDPCDLRTRRMMCHAKETKKRNFWVTKSVLTNCPRCARSNRSGIASSFFRPGPETNYNNLFSFCVFLRPTHFQFPFFCFVTWLSSCLSVPWSPNPNDHF